MAACRGEPGSEPQRLGRLAHFDQIGPAQGQGAGLVEDDGVGLGQALQRRGGLQQDSPAQEAAAGDHLDRRDCQGQGAGAGDDQDRNGDHQGRLPGESAEQQPAEKGDQGQEMDHRRIELGDPVGEGDVAGPPLFGQLHQADDLGQDGGLADRLGLQGHRCGQVERAGEDHLARPHRLGQGLAGDQAGVDLGTALDHLGIDRDTLARGDQDPLAAFHRLRRHGAAAAVRLQQRHRAAAQGQQALGGGARAAACPMVEVAADQQEEQQGHRGVEVGVFAAVDRLEEAHARGEQHAERDRHVHVRPPAAQGGEGGAEEGPAGEEDRRQRDQGREPVQQVAGRRSHVMEVPGPDRDRKQHHVAGCEAGDRQRDQQLLLAAVFAGALLARIEGRHPEAQALD